MHDRANHAYNDVIKNFGTYTGIGKGVKYTESVNETIERASELLKQIADNKKDTHYLKGDLAEVWHTETANICAVAKGKGYQYFIAPRDSSVIDVTGSDALEFLKYQLKYYKTPEDTAKAISNPKYFGLLKLVPADQLKEVKDAAYSLYLKNVNTRPEQAANYLHTYQVATDRVIAGNVRSTPLSEQEALQIVKEIQRDKFYGKDYGLSLSEYIGWMDIARASGDAALTAAVTTVAMKIAPDLFSLIKKALLDENIDLSDVQKLGSKALEGGVEGSLRGGIAAFITIACKTGKLGTSLMQIDPSIIGVATAVAIDCIKNAFSLYSGKITSYEYVDNCLRDSLILGLGISGMVMGQILIPVPILGSVIGNIVGTLFATIIYTGAKTFLLQPMLLSGFTFFGLVKQDYSLPEKVLDEMGIDTIDLDHIGIERLDHEAVDLELIDLDRIKFTMLERGFVKVDVVGNVVI
ncbi:MAG TPA: hypothetical protein PLN88_03930 [Candidatus Cloacimonadota bacterium]|jgi:hypothetical protein|nr:hypothetical protein [Candidatus Cloacimonadota bacterium]